MGSSSTRAKLLPQWVRLAFETFLERAVRLGQVLWPARHHHLSKSKENKPGLIKNVKSRLGSVVMVVVLVPSAVSYYYQLTILDLSFKSTFLRNLTCRDVMTHRSSKTVDTWAMESVSPTVDDDLLISVGSRFCVEPLAVQPRGA